MRRFSLLALAAVVAVVVFPSASVPLESTLGFVDIQRVLLEYKKTAEISASLDKRILQAKNEMKRDRDKILAQKQELEGSALAITDDPLTRLEKEREIALAQIQLEIREKHFLVELERDLVEHMKKVFKEVEREAQAISSERGLAAVFLANNEEPIGRTRLELTRSMQLRQVLYFDERLDLTAEIIRRLNR